MKASDIVKNWVDTYKELVGPFETAEEAQAYIDDRDDHGYDVSNWEIVTFKKMYTSPAPKKEFVVKNGRITTIENN